MKTAVHFAAGKFLLIDIVTKVLCKRVEPVFRPLFFQDGRQTESQENSFCA